MADLPLAAFERILAIVKSDDVAEVRVGRSRVALVDAVDLPLVAGYKWFSNGRYAYARTSDGVVLMHRLIAGRNGLIVDHEDGDGFNNRRYNLRPCTHAENMKNRCSVSGVSRFKGVWPERGKWRAGLKKDGQRINLGYFHSENKAARAYDDAATEHFGEFAKTNSSLGLL